MHPERRSDARVCTDVQILVSAFSQCSNDPSKGLKSVSADVLKRALTLALDVLRAADETSVELTSVTAVQNGTEEIEEMFAERVMAAEVDRGGADQVQESEEDGGEGVSV